MKLSMKLERKMESLINKVTSTRHMTFKLDAFRPSCMDELRNICPVIDGIVLEALVMLKYKGKISQRYGHYTDLVLDTIIDKIDVNGDIAKSGASEHLKNTIKSLNFDISLCRKIFTAEIVGSLHMITIAGYIQYYTEDVSNEVSNDVSKIDVDDETFKKYCLLMFDCYPQVDRYITAVVKSLDIDPEFNVSTTCEVDNQKITGVCDIVTNNMVIDIKVSEKNDESIRKWKTQLVCYNLDLKRPNIAVLNLLENEFILFDTPVFD